MTHTPLAGERLQPLGHLSECLANDRAFDINIVASTHKPACVSRRVLPGGQRVGKHKPVSAPMQAVENDQPPVPYRPIIPNPVKALNKGCPCERPPDPGSGIKSWTVRGRLRERGNLHNQTNLPLLRRLPRRLRLLAMTYSLTRSGIIHNITKRKSRTNVRLFRAERVGFEPTMSF